MDKKELSLADRFKVHAAVNPALTFQLSQEEALLFARCLKDWEIAQKVIEIRKVDRADERECERRKKAILTKWEVFVWTFYLGAFVWMCLTAAMKAVF